MAVATQNNNVNKMNKLTIDVQYISNTTKPGYLPDVHVQVVHSDVLIHSVTFLLANITQNLIN